MYGNAPRVLWERWTPPDEHNRIQLACRCMLVREPDRWILLETGVGAFFAPRLRARYGVEAPNHALLDNLAALGLSHEDIDVVVLSHLHFDHAGGLLAAWRKGDAPTLLFPRATFVVGQLAWERASNPHPRDKASFIPVLPDLLTASGRLEVISGSRSSALGDDYRFVVSNGHTPGMLLTEVPGQHGPVLFAADLVPGRPWVRTAITMGYDRCAELVIDEKLRLFSDLVHRNGRLFFVHDPACAMATVAIDEGGEFCSEHEQAELVDVVA